MSERSPFRLSDDSMYRWPPEPAPVIERTYVRATSLIGDGEPQPWMRGWLTWKIYAPWVCDHIEELIEYYTTPNPSQPFSIDPEWWDDVLRRARNQDEKALRNGKKAWKVAQVTGWDPRERLRQYVVALPDIVRDKAATQGTKVHGLLEDAFTGNPVQVEDFLVNHFNNGLKFWDDFGLTPASFLEVESVIYNDRFGYAGQFDGMLKISVDVLHRLGYDVSKYEGREYITVMFDYKTSAKPDKKPHGIKSSIALQFALYSQDENFVGRLDGSKDKLPPIDEFWGVNIRADGYDVVPVTVDDEVRAAMEHVIGVAHWMKNVESSVLAGSINNPPKRRAAKA